MFDVRKGVLCLVTAVCLAALHAPAWATALGLNQISTPDIQPLGVLAISGQFEHEALGNPQQLQLEIGLTRSFEVALFQGFSPFKPVFNAEYALVDTKPWLVSAGLLGTENATRYQPFLESGYYVGKGAVIAGIQRQEGNYVGVYGAYYQVTPWARIQTDYVSGHSSFATVGCTFTISPTVTFNPALYVSNSSPHKAFGYGVVSWQVKVW